MVERYIKARRRALERLYTGRVTVTVKKPVEDPVTGVTGFREEVLLEDEPCRLARQESAPATDDEPARSPKPVTVVLAPEVAIPAGSRLTITQHGVTATYRRSGQPHIHADHQSVPLTLEGEFA